MEVNSMEEYLTVEDVAEILKIGKKKAYKLVGQADFPKIKLGHTYRIPKSKFFEFLEHLTYTYYEI